VRRFRTVWKWLVPSWLQEGEGELIQYTQGLVNDAFAERCRQTVWLMLPSLAPADALPRIALDRGLPRGLFEPEASYRQRLIAWRYPKGHRVRGSALALLEQVSIALRGTAYVTIDQRGTRYDLATAPSTKGVTWDWDGAALTPNWARYWVIVKSAGTLPTTWDEGEAAGELWDGPPDECLAGEGIHVGELEAVRRIVRVGGQSWTPSGRRPVYLVLWFDGETFPAPTGDWDEWGNRPQQNHAFVPLHDSEV
jgi:hypothetical protein